MRDIIEILDRNDINQIIENNSEEVSEELKEILYNSFVALLVDVFERL